MPSSRSILRFIFPPCRSDLRTAKKPLRGSAGISWDGETSPRSRRSSSLESSTVWSIESPAETATISTRLLPRKPPRRLCQIDTIPPTATDTSVRKQIAERNNVSESYVVRSEKFMRGVEIMEQMMPGMQEKILSGQFKVRDADLHRLAKQTISTGRKSWMKFCTRNGKSSRSRTQTEPPQSRGKRPICRC